MTDAAFDHAHKAVIALVRIFHANEDRYLSSDYQEAEARKDFIDKFWIALGWDVNHDLQTNPYEQEAKVEPGVSVGLQQKRADYVFYLSPHFLDPKFYVEAKKPSRQLESPDHYFQAVRYGWNGGTPFAVLTDFEQFVVLDSRHKPDLATALNCGVARYRYADYLDQSLFAEVYPRATPKTGHLWTLENRPLTGRD